MIQLENEGGIVGKLKVIDSTSMLSLSKLGILAAIYTRSRVVRAPEQQHSRASIIAEQQPKILARLAHALTTRLSDWRGCLLEAKLITNTAGKIYITIRSCISILAGDPFSNLRSFSPLWSPSAARTRGTFSKILASR